MYSQLWVNTHEESNDYGQIVSWEQVGRKVV
jgi:hypothetical protein